LASPRDFAPKKHNCGLILCSNPILITKARQKETFLVKNGMEDVMMEQDAIDYQYDSIDTRTDVSTGRWTSEEHNLFLLGLKKYNKQWKSIAELVKSRTVVQIRTHAQKYFQKLDKMRDGKNRSSSSYDFQDDDVKSSSRTSSISTMESGDGDFDFEQSSNDNDGEPYKRPRYNLASSPRSKRQVRACTLQHRAASVAVASATAAAASSSAKVQQQVASPPHATRSKRTSHSRRPSVVTMEEEDEDEEMLHVQVEEDEHIDRLHEVQMQANDDTGDGDFFHFVDEEEGCEGEQLDESILNLLDKIDWDANHNQQGLLPSRCPSPFMDSAASVSSSLESYCFAEVLPLLDFSASTVAVDLLSPMSTATASSSSSSSSVIYHNQQVIHQDHFLHVPMPPLPVQPVVQQEQERVAFAHVIQEIKQVFGGLQQRRQLEQPQQQCEVKDANVPPLPSIRALIAMTSSRMNVAPAGGTHGSLTPSSNTFCHYPMNMVGTGGGLMQGFHSNKQEMDLSLLAASTSSSGMIGFVQQSSSGSASRKRGRPPRSAPSSTSSI